MAKEYIEREAMKQILGDLHFQNYGYAIMAVMEAPTADVVGVVRCKDCVKRKTQDCSMYYESDDEQYSWEVDDDFCSQGERRDN